MGGGVAIVSSCTSNRHIMLGIRVDLSEVWGTSSTAARRKHQGRIFRRTDYNSGGMCTGKKWTRFLDSYVAATNEKEVVLTAKKRRDGCALLLLDLVYNIEGEALVLRKGVRLSPAQKGHFKVRGRK